jgi:hypothetical protein
MNISKFVSLLERSIREGDVTSKEKKEQQSIDLEIPSNLKAAKKNHKKQEDKKQQNKNNYQLNNKEVSEEDDSPFDAFEKSIKKNDSTDDNEDDDELEDTEDANDNEDKKSKQQPGFKLSNAKQYTYFKDLVNKFRATESINKSIAAEKFYNKLTLGEKQTICLFFDSMTKVLNANTDADFKMPKTPLQHGIKIKEKVSSNEEHMKTISAAAGGDKNAEKKMSSMAPITVGESIKRSISIDNLLKEVK